jgi:S1-C subfamily serine protease
LTCLFVRHTILSFSGLAFILVPGSYISAELQDDLLREGIVIVTAYQGNVPVNRGSGIVVQADTSKAYVLTNSLIIRGADTITINDPFSGGELVVRILHNDPATDIALLEVGGLNAEVIEFSHQLPEAGDLIWSAMNVDNVIQISSGVLQSRSKGGRLIWAD